MNHNDIERFYYLANCYEEQLKLTTVDNEQHVEPLIDAMSVWEGLKYLPKSDVCRLLGFTRRISTISVTHVSCGIDDKIAYGLSGHIGYHLVEAIAHSQQPMVVTTDGSFPYILDCEALDEEFFEHSLDLRMAGDDYFKIEQAILPQIYALRQPLQGIQWVNGEFACIWLETFGMSWSQLTYYHGEEQQLRHQSLVRLAQAAEYILSP